MDKKALEPPMTVDLSVPPNRQPRFTNVRVHRRNLTRTTERDGWLQIQVTWQRRVEKPGTIVAEVEKALALRGGP